HLLAGRAASRTSDSSTISFLFRTPFPRLSLRLEEATHENISIAWQELPSASTYQVTVYQGTGANRFLLQDEPVMEGRFVLSPITPGNEYTFEVSAQDSAGLFSSLTARLIAQTDGRVRNRLPQANTDTLTRESKQIFVSWTPPLTTNVAGYRVRLYQGSVSDELVREQALDATSTSYTFSELIPATEYTLRLVALSDGINFSDSLPLDQSFTTTLLSPTSLEVTRNDAQGPAFQWQSVTGATLYQYRLYPVAQDLAAQSPVEFSDTLLTSVSIDIESLQGSTEYVFEVKAVNRDNLELSSNPPSSIRLNTLLTLPQVIDQTITENSFAITWQAVPSAETYRVDFYEGIDTDGTYLGSPTPTAASNGSNFSVAFEDLEQGSFYSYFITAIDSDGTHGNRTQRVTDITLGGARERVPAPILRVAPTDDGFIGEWENTANSQMYAVNVYVGNRATGDPLRSTTLDLGGIAGDSRIQADYEINMLQPFTEYTLRVIALSDEIAFANSAQAIAIFKTPHQNLNTPRLVSNTAERVAMSWDEIPSAVGYRYRLYVTGTEAPSFTFTADNAIAFSVEGLEKAREYTFEVKAAGDISSESLDSPTAASISFLTALPSFSLQREQDETSLTITWQPESTSPSWTYFVFVYDGNDSSGALVHNERVEEERIQILNLDRQTTYTVQILHSDTTGTYPDSAVSQGTFATTGDAGPRLNTPLINLVEANTNTLRVTWNSVANAQVYEVDIYTGDSTSKEAAGIATVGQSTSSFLSFTFNELEADTEYTVRVFARPAESASFRISLPSTTISRTIALPEIENLRIVEESPSTRTVVFNWDFVLPLEAGYEYRLYQQEADAGAFEATAMQSSNELMLIFSDEDEG
ncbi:MAG: fibronectin type III domain-containing protein, partial [Candidatus Oxydemutatoraceae bacterium WSBS_2016_MAG_OTU14]